MRHRRPPPGRLLDVLPWSFGQVRALSLALFPVSLARKPGRPRPHGPVPSSLFFPPSLPPDCALLMLSPPRSCSFNNFTQSTIQSHGQLPLLTVFFSHLLLVHSVLPVSHHHVCCVRREGCVSPARLPFPALPLTLDQCPGKIRTYPIKLIMFLSGTLVSAFTFLIIAGQPPIVENYGACFFVGFMIHYSFLVSAAGDGHSSRPLTTR